MIKIKRFIKRYCRRSLMCIVSLVILVSCISIPAYAADTYVGADLGGLTLDSVNIREYSDDGHYFIFCVTSFENFNHQ